MGKAAVWLDGWFGKVNTEKRSGLMGVMEK